VAAPIRRGPRGGSPALETAHDDRSALWLVYLLYDRAEGMALSNINFRRRVWLAAVGIKGVHMLSRPGARFRCCHRPVSPDRSPNPPYRSLGNGLSTAAAVRRGSQVAMGMGSCSPGRRNERPSRFRSGRTWPRPP
jgi:hypothetical protein